MRAAIGTAEAQAVVRFDYLVATVNNSIGALEHTQVCDRGAG